MLPRSPENVIIFYFFICLTFLLLSAEDLLSLTLLFALLNAKQNPNFNISELTTIFSISYPFMSYIPITFTVISRDNPLAHDVTTVSTLFSRLPSNPNEFRNRSRYLPVYFHDSHVSVTLVLFSADKAYSPLI
jgi:hypothetical protein